MATLVELGVTEEERVEDTLGKADTDSVTVDESVGVLEELMLVL